MYGPMTSALIDAENVRQSRSTRSASAQVVIVNLGAAGSSVKLMPGSSMIGQCRRAWAHCS